MTRLIGHPALNLDPRHSRPRRSARLLAITLVLALLVGSIAPGWSLAAEAESEGEGSAPPGLKNPEFEPGGAETVLESLPGSTAAEESEVEGGAPIETGPTLEVPPPEAPPAAEAQPAETEVETPVPAPAPAPTTVGPEYTPAAPPDYETTPAPTTQVVENEALPAPATSPGPTHGQTARQKRDSTAPEPPAEAPSPAAPTEEMPTAVAVVSDAARGGPTRKQVSGSSYTVRPGDCLWTIAAALLPRGADDAQIEAEVERLWRSNADRIGTGDPSLILVGTVLRLR